MHYTDSSDPETTLHKVMLYNDHLEATSIVFLYERTVSWNSVLSRCSHKLLCILMGFDVTVQHKEDIYSRFAMAMAGEEVKGDIQSVLATPPNIESFGLGLLTS